MRVSGLLALGAGVSTVNAGVINGGNANAGANTLHARTFCFLSGLLPSLFGNSCSTPYTPPVVPTPSPPPTTGTGRCSNGQAPQIVYTTPNGYVYGICGSTDFPGGTFTTQSGVPYAQKCADICSVTSGCIGATYNPVTSVCSLKSSLAPATFSTQTSAVYEISRPSTPSSTTSSATTPATPSGTGLCANGAGPNSVYTTPEGDTYGVCLNTNLPGNDITTTRTNTNTACADVCSRTAGCQSTTWDRNSQTCYLKSTVPRAVYDPTYDSTYKISTAPRTTTTSSAATPSGTGLCANGAGPNSVYTTPEGDTYGVCLNTNLPGNDITTTRTNTNTACADVCSRTAGCQSTTWDRNSQTCYLKSTVPRAVYDPTYDSTYKISTAPRTSTTTPASSTTTSGIPYGTGRCANGAGPSSTYTAANGDVYGICPNTDFGGGDQTAVGGIPSVNACADACSATAGCAGAAYFRSGSVCYLKSTLNTPSINPNTDGIYKISSGTGTRTTTPVVSTTASATPQGTGRCANGAGPSSTYTAANGDVYGICPNTDFGGGDQTAVGGIPSVNACADACSASAGCAGAAYFRSGSVCYLKSTINTPSVNPNTDGIYKISTGTRTTTPVVTTTSARASTTAQVTTSAAPGSPVCGVAGYDKQNPAAYKSDYTGSCGTFNTCKAFCQGALSFAVGANTCLCYNAPVSGNFNPSPGSPYLFYDVSCPAPSNGGNTTPVNTTPAITTPATTPSGCAPAATVTVTKTVTK